MVSSLKSWRINFRKTQALLSAVSDPLRIWPPRLHVNKPQLSHNGENYRCKGLFLFEWQKAPMMSSVMQLFDKEPTSAQWWDGVAANAWFTASLITLPRLGERSNNFPYSCIFSLAGWAACCEHPTVPTLSVSGVESVFSNGRWCWGSFFSLSCLVYAKHNSCLLKEGKKVPWRNVVAVNRFRRAPQHSASPAKLQKGFAPALSSSLFGTEEQTHSWQNGAGKAYVLSREVTLPASTALWIQWIFYLTHT